MPFAAYIDDCNRWRNAINAEIIRLAVGSLVAAATVIHINRPYVIIVLALAFCAIGETLTVFRNW